MASASSSCLLTEAMRFARGRSNRSGAPLVDGGMLTKCLHIYFYIGFSCIFISADPGPLAQNSLRGSSRQGRVCVQGLVTYYSATADTGGLCVIPGSHRRHDELCQRTPSAKNGIDFVSVDPDDEILCGDGVLVCAQAGGAHESIYFTLLYWFCHRIHLTCSRHTDLILWDSRTVHCNTPAPSQTDFFSLPECEQRRQAAQQPQELIRLCSYVCMVPRSHATPEELRTKVALFSNR
jgi:hypothetical protein